MHPTKHPTGGGGDVSATPGSQFQHPPQQTTGLESHLRLSGESHYPNPAKTKSHEINELYT